MTDTFARAQQLVAALTGAGIRASLDPSALNPPSVLVVPPSRTYDLPCGFTAGWDLIALAPGAQGMGASTWGSLDTMVEAVAATVGFERAEFVSYVLNGQTFPAYICSFTEALA